MLEHTANRKWIKCEGDRMSRLGVRMWWSMSGTRRVVCIGRRRTASKPPDLDRGICRSHFIRRAAHKLRNLVLNEIDGALQARAVVRRIQLCTRLPISTRSLISVRNPTTSQNARQRPMQIPLHRRSSGLLAATTSPLPMQQPTDDSTVPSIRVVNSKSAGIILLPSR